jgi:hypothetical protein
MTFITTISIVLSLILVTQNTSLSNTAERCYTSTNNRGEAFWLYINYDRYGKANRIRYNDKKSSIPLSYYGREKRYFSMNGSYQYVSTYYETYKGNVTGKLYILDEVNEDGVSIVFERMKDGQIFLFEECDI